MIDKNQIEAIAIGLIHSYANSMHEEKIAERLSAARPDLSITLSSQVCPEIREYERQSTACANAYVQPLMSRYLTKLDEALQSMGFMCILLMTSGGGLTTLDTSIKFLFDWLSRTSWRCYFSNEIAKECGIDNVLSFDMEVMTAKNLSN